MDWTKGFQFIPSDRDGLWLEERVEDLRQEKTVTSPQRVSYYITIVLWHGLYNTLYVHSTTEVASE